MMKRFWKKAEWTGMTALPMVISLAAQVFFYVLFIFAVSMIMGFIGGASGEVDTEAVVQRTSAFVTENAMVAVLLYHLWAFVVFGIWYYHANGRSKPQKPSRVLSGKAVLATVLMGLFTCFTTEALMLSAEYVVPDLINQFAELVENAGLGTDPLGIFTAVIIAPIGEELVCRGLIFHYARKVVEGMKSPRAAFWIANTLQALMFGIMHGNLVQGTYAFLIGLCLGWLRQRYNSLYPAMLAHFVHNFCTTFFMGALFGLVPEALPLYLALLAVGIAMIVLLMIREKKGFQQSMA